MRTNWARRWFRLDARNKQLLYYKTADGAELKGIVELVGSVASACSGKEVMHQIDIRSAATKRVYQLRAESELDDSDLSSSLASFRLLTDGP